MRLIIKLNDRCRAKNAAALIRELGAADKPDVSEVELDLRGMKFYEPLPLCIILATVSRWRAKDGKKVDIKYYSNTDGGYYFERIDFFKHLGLDVNSGRQRHDTNDNFIGIRSIHANTDCPQLSTEIASCLVRELTGPQAVETKQLMEYLLGEVIMNCKQHSRGVGFLHGQFFKNEGMFHLALADDGIGILGSYRDQGSPRYHQGASEVDMLDEALSVESSSTTHKRGIFGEESPNRGIGLPMCRTLTQDATGLFCIYSGEAFVFDDFGKDGHEPGIATRFPGVYRGVAVGLGFTRSAVGQSTYNQILKEVKIKLKLQSPDGATNTSFGFIP